MLQIPSLYVDPLNPPETLTEAGAHDLAARIMAYWMDRGYFGVEVRVERQAVQQSGFDHGHAIWVVRSDMVGGMPKSG